ncbi:MAG: DUF58 domain-containing protein [Firmicutes bacterium]|nr:DUF58 domain-containing protein [Bacillota bacterium]
MQQVKSNFVNPAGLAVLAALALLSAYFGIDLLFAVLAGAFLLCLISWLWTRSSLKKLDVRTGTRVVCGFPGDTLDVDVTLSNDKFIPVVWLRAELPAGEAACVSMAEEDAAVFSWVMPHQSLEWTETLSAVKRGVKAFGCVEASSGDGFGLSENSVSIPLDTELRAVVFPSLIEVDVSGILSRLSEMELSKKGMYTDASLIQNVRDYSGSESFRDVNWRLLAKGGDLMVNIREKMDVRRTCLFVDLQSCSRAETVETPSGPETVHRLMEEELERMLSLAASLISQLSVRGVICSLAIPGYDVHDEATGTVRREARTVRPAEGEDQAETLLTALAEIDYQGGSTELPLEQISGEYHALGQMFCLARKKSRRLDALDAAQPLPVWYVLPEDDGSGRIIEETELLR